MLLCVCLCVCVCGYMYSVCVCVCVCILCVCILCKQKSENTENVLEPMPRYCMTLYTAMFCHVSLCV